MDYWYLISIYSSNFLPQDESALEHNDDMDETGDENADLRHECENLVARIGARVEANQAGQDNREKNK